jgi:sulfoxide reductase catalytic subunit YedY
VEEGKRVMLIRKSSDIRSSEITPRSVYDAFRQDRRQFLSGIGALGAAAFAASVFPRSAFAETTKLTTVPSQYKVNETVTPASKAQSYNNYYEFGTDKSEPAKNAHTLRTRPWTVKFSGLVKKTQFADIDALMRYRPIEDRTYRFRCVEAWSMVIPWNGYSLSEIIKWADPLPSAKFVQFISLADKSQMPQLGSSGINPPYSEGLRMDEAMNPLALLTFGAYGETLANQQGAPVRVIVPWKYGFKSAKSIVEIRFVDKMPHTTWNDLASNEYGFYSNVNPSVDHPRWSQASERRLDTTGGSLFTKRIPTLPFNGYANEVASLYQGMDLKKNF